MEQEASAQLNFWQRQIHGEPTTKQIVFDVVFGVVVPILCFIYDPIVFPADMGDSVLGDYQGFAYLLSGIEIVALIFWFLLRPIPGLWNCFVGGVLFAGAFFCFVIGAVLFPLSLIGLLFLIGLLGFIPFVTAHVYFRNGYRAVKSLSPGYLPGQVGLGLLGALLALTTTFALANGIDRYVINSVDEILEGNAEQALNAARRVRPLSLVSGAKCQRISAEYLTSTDPARKERLARLYKEATGEEIAFRARFGD